MRPPTPMKAIRAKCLDCSAGQYSEVSRCPVTDCPLWAWRFGHRPATVEKHELRRISGAPSVPDVSAPTQPPDAADAGGQPGGRGMIF